MPEESEFSYPRANLIASREGFAVEIHHSAIRYSEGDRATEIFAEALVGAPEIAIRRSDVRVWEGPRREAITDADRGRIIENITRALAFKDWVLVVE